MRRLAFVSFAALVSCTSELRAQTVGTLPDQSPFLDVRDTQRFGVTAGWLFTGHDPAGVGPKSAPIVGVRYDLAIGGPMYLSGSLFGTSTSRTVLDYTKSAASRNIGTQGMELVGVDAAIAMSLTGARTWHHLQPLVNLGFGLTAGPGDKQDISGYQFSPAFTFSYGFGVRYSTGRNSELRVDLNQYWWQLKYPTLYRSTQGSPVPIRPTGSLNAWTANTGLTLGWTIRSFR